MQRDNVNLRFDILNLNYKKIKGTKEAREV